MSDPAPPPAPPADPAAPPPDPPAPATPPPAPDPATAKTVEMTQAEFDAIVAREKAKAVKNAQDEAHTKAEREKMDETERLKAELADRDTATAAATAKANERIATAELKVEASGLGVKPDRLDAFLRIAGIDGLEVDEDGKVTGAKKLAADTLKAFPEFKTTNGAGRAGGRHNGEQPEGRAANLEDAVSARLAG